MDWVNVLYIGALFFFNLLCILGIILSIVCISAVMSIKSKTNETLDLIQEKTEELGDASVGFLGGLLDNLFWRQSGILGKVLKNFLKR